jgi:hypothetical protein
MDRKQKVRRLSKPESLRRHRRDGWHWMVGVEKAGLEGRGWR